MRTFLACFVVLFTGSVALAQSAAPEQKAQLAPTGKLRAAVVTIPFLAKQDAGGQAAGVAADLGVEMARAMGVPYEAIGFKAPPDGGAAVRDGSGKEEMVGQKLRKATRLLVPLSDHKKAFEMIKNGEADAFVDLLYQTVANQADMPGTRIVPGAIGRNALAVGYGKDKPAAAAFAKAFTDTAIKSGLVAKSIPKTRLPRPPPP